MLYYEFKTLRIQGVKRYFSDLFNIIDLIFVLIYITGTVSDLSNLEYETVNILYSFAIIFLGIRLFSYLRLFTGFSFLVSMLREVFYDLRYFISLYGFVIIFYGLIFTLLKIKSTEEDNEYEGISYFGYYIMAFRASTGDFQLD